MSRAEEPDQVEQPAARGGRIMRALRRKFVQDTVVLQVGMAVTMATYLCTSVLLARGLGPQEFGRYTIAFTLYSLVYFVANLGVTTAAVSQYARACGEKDDAAKVEVLASFLKAFLVMGLAILALGYFLPDVAEWFYADREVGWFAWALCLLGPLQMFNGFILVALQGARRMRDYVLFDNGCGILRTVLLFFAILNFAELWGVVLATLAAGLCTSLVGLRTYGVVRRESAPEDAPPPLATVLRAVPRAPLATLCRSGTLIAVNKNGNELLRCFANALIGKVAGTVELAHFRVAFYYIWAVQQLLGGLGRALLPMLGFRLGTSGGDMNAFRRDVARVAVVSGCFFIIITALFVAVAPLAVRVLYGGDYEEATLLIFIMAIGHLVLGFSVVSDPFYIYTKQLGLSARINLAQLFVVLIPVGYVLIKAYGVIGGAVFSAFGMVFQVIHLLVIWRYFRRHRGLAALEPGTR